MGGRRRFGTLASACASLIALAGCAPSVGGPAAAALPTATAKIVSVSFSGAYDYAATGPATGALDVTRSDGNVTGVQGTVHIPGRGAWPTTVTFDVSINALLGVATGSIDVEDPAAGIGLTTTLVLSPTATSEGSIAGHADGSRVWRLIETLPFRLDWSIADGTGSTPAAPELAAATSGSIDVATYNVAGLPEPISGSKPATYSELLSPLLNPFDVVLLQEDFFYPDKVAKHLTYPYGSTPQRLVLGSDPSRPEAFVGSGLERYSRHPFDGYRHVRWPGCYGGALGGGAADCLSQKGFSVARHEVAQGVFVDVYDLHGEAGSTPEDVFWSQQDYLALAADINANSVGHAVIVGGDFNLNPSDEIDGPVLAQLLVDAGLTDVCEVQDCSADPDAIDRLLFRSGDDVALEATAWSRPAGFNLPDGTPLSDHDPTAATFAWSVVDG